jgi:ferritin-like metal-binding protein YciE
MATQKITTPDELLHLQLRTALTMEDHSLAALGVLANAAKSPEIKKMFRHHADETKEQIENLHKVFGLLELEPTTAPSPSTTGISKQAESLISRASGKVLDHVVLTSALGNEHYEMSAYEALLIPVTRMGMTDAVALLQSNLDQEVHTSEELRMTLERIAA